MKSFDYHKPSSVSEAAKLLSQDDAIALAGGMTLLPTMKQRLNSPRAVVDLAGIEELRGIRIHDTKGLVIGAMTTHSEVAASDLVCKQIPALAQLAGNIGDAQVRNRGTAGGSLANNDPAADYPAAFLALGGSVHTNKREINADDFFAGLFSTTLEAGEVSICRYRKKGASDFAQTCICRYRKKRHMQKKSSATPHRYMLWYFNGVFGDRTNCKRRACCIYGAGMTVFFAPRHWKKH